jgi:hypothetical protein
MLPQFCKVPDQPMPSTAWEEYKVLTRRLEWFGWRYSSVYKYRRDELLEMFADVLVDGDDIGEPDELVVEKKKLIKSFR